MMVESAERITVLLFNLVGSDFYRFKTCAGLLSFACLHWDKSDGHLAISNHEKELNWIDSLSTPFIDTRKLKLARRGNTKKCAGNGFIYITRRLKGYWPLLNLQFLSAVHCKIGMMRNLTFRAGNSTVKASNPSAACLDATWHSDVSQNYLNTSSKLNLLNNDGINYDLGWKWYTDFPSVHLRSQKSLKTNDFSSD